MDKRIDILFWDVTDVFLSRYKLGGLKFFRKKKRQRERPLAMTHQSSTLSIGCGVLLYIILTWAGCVAYLFWKARQGLYRGISKVRLPRLFLYLPFWGDIGIKHITYMSNTNLSTLKTEYTQPELDVINVEVSDSFLITVSGTGSVEGGIGEPEE